MEKAASEMREKRTGSAAVNDTPFFGGGWQGEAMRRQYELDRAMGGSWN